MGLFLMILVGGMGLFLFRYATQAPDWVMTVGSPHVYNKGNLGCGTVVDRAGNVLLDMEYQRQYSYDGTTRRSTLHWLGDRQGFIRAGAVSHYAAALAGYDVVDGVYNYSGTGGTQRLTLSARVQNAALNALNGRRGTVAVYNYKTGEILCAVTAPTFDPDNVPDFEQDTTGAYEGVYHNRFLQSSYTPGSIYKVVTCAAALDCVPGIETKFFTCTGRHAYGKEAVTCETAHGQVTLRQALAHSCNCAFAQVAELVGRRNMKSYVQQFRINDAVSFDGVTTSRGQYEIDDAGATSYAWSCIGQHTDLVNPCRFMLFMGQIAGGGKAALPYIVSRVESEGAVLYQAQTVSSDRIMNEELARTMRDYMRNNVEVTYGAWKFPGLTVCAKSGTAQLAEGKEPNALFSGFVSDARYPLAFICVVEGGGYGASACVPVMSTVLAECKAIIDAGY